MTGNFGVKENRLSNISLRNFGYTRVNVFTQFSHGNLSR